MSLVPAARQLVDEVEAAHPKAKVKIIGDPDGIGVHRQVSFDAATTKWLTPLLDAVQDERVLSVDAESNRTVITFVADTRADFAQPFGLAEADAVLNE
jgi:hypothetical protein